MVGQQLTDRKPTHCMSPSETGKPCDRRTIKHHSAFVKPFGYTSIPRAMGYRQQVHEPECCRHLGAFNSSCCYVLLNFAG